MNELHLPPAPPLPPEVRERVLASVLRRLDDEPASRTRRLAAPLIAAAAVVAVTVGAAVSGTVLGAPSPAVAPPVVVEALPPDPAPWPGPEDGPAPEDRPSTNGSTSALVDCVGTLPAADRRVPPPAYEVVVRLDLESGGYVLGARTLDGYAGLCLGSAVTESTAYWAGPVSAPPATGGTVLASQDVDVDGSRIVLLAVGTEIDDVALVGGEEPGPCARRAGLAVCAGDPDDTLTIRLTARDGAVTDVEVPVAPPGG